MTTEYFRAARRLAENGYLPIQVHPGQKRPRGDGWQQQRNTPEDCDRIVASGYASDGVGILTGVGETPVCLVDIDCLDAALVSELRAWCDRELGLGVERVGLAPKTGLVYRCPPGLTKVSSPVYTDGEGRRAQLEILLGGQQFVLRNRHPDGHEYSQPGLTTLEDTPASELPLITRDQMLTALARFEDAVEARGWTREGPRRLAAAGRAADDDGIPDPPTQLTVEEVRALLEWFTEEVDDYDAWTRMGQALHHQFGGAEEGLALWDAWSQQGVKYQGEDDLRQKWDTFGRHTGRAATLRTYLARAKALREAAGREEVDRAMARIAAAPDVLTLMGPVAQVVGRVAREHEAFAPQLRLAMQRRYAGVAEGARLPVAQLNLAMAEPRARVVAGQRFLDAEQERAVRGLQLPTNDAGRIIASLGSLDRVLSDPAYCGVELAWDEFKAEQVISRERINGVPQWQTLRDSDLVRLRQSLENGGGLFTTVGREMMRDIAMAVCDAHRIHTAQAWLKSLPPWDGVPRITQFLARWCGAPDTPYSRAVSTYLWTALAGRLRSPGMQADIVPVLVGDQGVRKTSLLRNLVPSPEQYGELHLEMDEANLARSLRGKIIIEINELKGLRNKEREALKAFLTRTHDSWIIKFREAEHVQPRTFVPVGTTNLDELLDDPTGSRRWAPLRVAQIMLDEIMAVREQLWAEAALAWDLGGLAWQEVENLARAEHGEYRVTDAWEDPIADWLAGTDDLDGGGPTRGQDPGGVGLHELLQGALGIANGHINRGVELRAGAILRGFGFAKRDVRVGRTVKKRWVALVAHAD